MWKSIYAYISYLFKNLIYLYYYKQLKQFKMAFTERSYYITTEIDQQLLRSNMQRCKNQDYALYELIKVFGCMTKWDAYDLHHEFKGPILDSSVSRSLATLVKAGIIEKTGEMVMGDLNQPNNLYRLLPNAPLEIPKVHNTSLPKSLSVDIIYTENGIDIDGVLEAFSNKLVELENRLNQI